MPQKNHRDYKSCLELQKFKIGPIVQFLPNSFLSSGWIVSSITSVRSSLIFWISPDWEARNFSKSLIWFFKSWFSFSKSSSLSRTLISISIVSSSAWSSLGRKVQISTYMQRYVTIKGKILKAKAKLL